MEAGPKFLHICYRCSSSLNADNESYEHIIPKSLGGTATSKRLLCRTCNNECGHSIDQVFVKSLKQFYSLLLIKNSKGDYTKTKIDFNDGKKFELNPDIGLIRDTPEDSFEFNEHGYEYKIAAKNKKQAMSYLKKYSSVLKKSPEINWHMEELHSKVGPGKKMNLYIPKGELIPAISKIAINLHLTHGGILEDIPHLIENLSSNKSFTGVYFYYPRPDPVKHKESFLHVFHHVKDTNENLEYIYIELFGTLKFLVIIRLKAEIAFSNTIAINPISGEKISLKLDKLIRYKKVNRLSKIHDQNEAIYEQTFNAKLQEAWNYFDSKTKDKRMT